MKTRLFALFALLSQNILADPMCERSWIHCSDPNPVKHKMQQRSWVHTDHGPVEYKMRKRSPRVFGSIHDPSVGAHPARRQADKTFHPRPRALPPAQYPRLHALPDD